MDLSLLPQALRNHAVVLGGELAFPRAVAHEVLDALRQQAIAVIGVEVWTADTESDAPKVWGWSEYEVQRRGDWQRFVDQNYDLAILELEKHVPVDAVWHFTVVPRDERM